MRVSKALIGIFGTAAALYLLYLGRDIMRIHHRQLALQELREQRLALEAQASRYSIVALSCGPTYLLDETHGTTWRLDLGAGAISNKVVPVLTSSFDAFAREAIARNASYVEVRPFSVTQNGATITTGYLTKAQSAHVRSALEATGYSVDISAPPQDIRLVRIESLDAQWLPVRFSPFPGLHFTSASDAQGVADALAASSRDEFIQNKLVEQANSTTLELLSIIQQLETNNWWASFGPEAEQPTTPLR